MPARSTAKVSAPWTAEMEAQATTFYLRHYLEVFGGPDVRDAFAQILQLMMWDDHDIWWVGGMGMGMGMGMHGGACPLVFVCVQKPAGGWEETA